MTGGTPGTDPVRTANDLLQCWDDGPPGTSEVADNEWHADMASELAAALRSVLAAPVETQYSPDHAREQSRVAGALGRLAVDLPHDQDMVRQVRAALASGVPEEATSALEAFATAVEGALANWCWPYSDTGTRNDAKIVSAALRRTARWASA